MRCRDKAVYKVGKRKSGREREMEKERGKKADEVGKGEAASERERETG